jgi:hypothetical protein
MGEERRMWPLLLNWMTGMMEETIHRANSTGRPEFRFVLTGQKQKPSSWREVVALLSFAYFSCLYV